MCLRPRFSWFHVTKSTFLKCVTNTAVSRLSRHGCLGTACYRSRWSTFGLLPWENVCKVAIPTCPSRPRTLCLSRLTMWMPHGRISIKAFIGRWVALSRICRPETEINSRNAMRYYEASAKTLSIPSISSSSCRKSSNSSRYISSFVANTTPTTRTFHSEKKLFAI